MPVRCGTANKKNELPWEAHYLMKVSDFDYQLPQELIAQQPLPSRDQSRLLVLARQQQDLVHTKFCQLPGFLAEGDLLVINDTRVLPARLAGRKATGGQVEILLLTPEGNGRWSCLAKPARRLNSLSMDRHSLPSTCKKSVPTLHP